jgi:riboflavin kinase/FMN adenylyltransferase
VVAIGTFDGVHLGHRRVLEAARASGRMPTAVTFDPHPRIAFGYDVRLLTTLERRLELIGEAVIEDVLVVEFGLEVSRLGPEEFANAVLRPIGTEVVVAGADFRFGRGRSGDLALLEELGFETRVVPLVEGVSSSTIRDLLRAGNGVFESGKRRVHLVRSPDEQLVRIHFHPASIRSLGLGVDA